MQHGNSDSLFYVSPNAIARCRVLRSPDGRITDIRFEDANQAFAELVGLGSPGEALQESGQDLLPTLFAMAVDDPGWNDPSGQPLPDADFERFLPELDC